jgi:hypothetical protein
MSLLHLGSDQRWGLEKRKRKEKRKRQRDGEENGNDGEENYLRVREKMKRGRK